MIEIDLTDGACNQNCIHCYFESGSGNNLRQINPKKLISFAEEAFVHGTRAFELVGGGEPTAHDNIEDIISEIANFSTQIPGESAQIGMATNGVLLEKVFPSMKGGYLRWVRVSLDAGCLETYCNLHRVKEYHFTKVIKNLQTATNLMNPEDVGIGYLVVPPHNSSSEEISQAVKLAANLGVGHIAFRPVQSNENISSRTWREVIDAINQARNQYSGQVDILGGRGDSWEVVLNSSKRDSANCLLRPLVMVIKANGDLAPCFLYRENSNRSPFGNIDDGYVSAWEENPLHLTSWLQSDVAECPPICKFHKYHDCLSSTEVRRNDGKFATPKHRYFI